MNSTLSHWAHVIGTSALHDHIVHWLRTVPGLPPIVQTIHIVCIGCIMASIVMVELRVLNWAARGQDLIEMSRRLSGWMWGALIVLACSGLLLVIAQPRRYFSNPVFGVKMALLVVALASSVWVMRIARRSAAPGVSAKALAAMSLLMWLSVVLAGRWIAYVDYLLPVE